MKTYLAPLAGALFVFFSLLPGVDAAEAGAVQRGAYIFHAAGCAGCHTDHQAKGPLLGGGGPLKTPFGIFYGPNITAHPTAGIGTWSDGDFIRALRQGVAPDGSHYFPVFPFTSFAAMTKTDARDLKAYIFSLPPVARPNRPHKIKFPFGWRPLMAVWKDLFLDPPAPPDPAKGALWNRGAYLAGALGHCGECHTPRNFLGGLSRELSMAGSRQGPDGNPVPNITPHKKVGIGGWSSQEIVDLLKSGMLPDGDFVGGAMGEVVEGTAKLNDTDLKALAHYLKNLPPAPNDPFAKR
ncbi:MAG: cytochrome c [Rhodospirillales bacterium]|nr:cytochrome c [Rhodospirillales bacterium]